MTDHAVVSHDEWLEHRRKFLDEEKAFTRERDRLNAARTALANSRVSSSAR